MNTNYKERIKAYLRCISARLLDQNRAPRRWWWPPEHRLEFSSAEEWQRQHDEVSHTLQRVMLTLLGYSFFCVLTLGAPDISLIASDATIDLPLTGTKVNYTGFLAIGPLVLIGVTVYLHIFLGYHQALTRSGESSELPFLFNMSHRGARWLTGFFFYWLPSLVLAGFTWKALPRSLKASLLTVTTAAVTASLVWLQIRRCPAEQRNRRNPVRWVMLCALFLVTAVQLSSPGKSLFSREMQLYKASLANQDLKAINLVRANLQEADLQKADLVGARLQGADLKWAQLQGADLWQAQLQGADLRKAGIGGAEFKNANLDFTNLRDLGRTPLTKEGSAGADFNQDCGYHSVSSFRGLSFPATMRR